MMAREKTNYHVTEAAIQYKLSHGGFYNRCTACMVFENHF